MVGGHYDLSTFHWVLTGILASWVGVKMDVFTNTGPKGRRNTIITLPALVQCSAKYTRGNTCIISTYFACVAMKAHCVLMHDCSLHEAAITAVIVGKHAWRREGSPTILKTKIHFCCVHCHHNNDTQYYFLL